MKILTISQPYASLIRDGVKPIENRTWGTRHRGLLGIHAGLGTQYMSRWELGGPEAPYPGGCLLAVARLVDCVRIETLRIKQSEGHGKQQILPGYTIDQLLDHEHTEGPVCWLLDDIVPLKTPMPMKGAQGLWEWTPPPGWIDAYDRRLRELRQVKSQESRVQSQAQA